MRCYVCWLQLAQVAAGKAEDRGGPSAVAALKEVGEPLGGVAIVATAVVADEVAGIQSVLKKWCDSGMVDFVITTGGTGFTRVRAHPSLASSLAFDVSDVVERVVNCTRGCGFGSSTFLQTHELQYDWQAKRVL